MGGLVRHRSGLCFYRVREVAAFDATGEAAREVRETLTSGYRRGGHDYVSLMDKPSQ